MTQGVVIKRNLIIFDNEDLWEPIKQKILAEYGPTHVISWVMKRELGFTARRHQNWQTVNKNHVGEDITVRWYFQNQVHLDFFNDAAQSWFQLKYL